MTAVLETRRKAMSTGSRLSTSRTIKIALINEAKSDSLTKVCKAIKEIKQYKDLKKVMSKELLNQNFLEIISGKGSIDIDVRLLNAAYRSKYTDFSPMLLLFLMALEQTPVKCPICDNSLFDNIGIATKEQDLIAAVGCGVCSYVVEDSLIIKSLLELYKEDLTSVEINDFF